MVEHTGWLLDIYPAHQPSPNTIGGGAILWLLCQRQDGEVYRLRLEQEFPVTFYVAGTPQQLRTVWRFLQARPERLELARSERRDLFQPQPLSLLAVRVHQPSQQPRLFHLLAEAFPDLTYYDADLTLALRHAAAYGSFPLAHCHVMVDERNRIQKFTVLDSPWELDPPFPPLQILTIQPEVDPFHAEPQRLLIQCLSQRGSYELALQPERPLLINLRAILQRHNPDLLLTMWGDTWMLPHLLSLSQRWRIPLPLNRDGQVPVAYRRERTYFTYGQVVYRGRQVLLSGRWHLDAHNAMLFHDYALDGVLEMARVTSLPVQLAGRLSPGSGISTMQMQTALRQGILVPWRKQQAEHLKTAFELIGSDQGGMVYQPTIGLHSQVAEIDFVSMYPSIMARFNISPETIGSQRPTAELVPELGMIVDRALPGLVPQTLQPLLDKRLALKRRLMELPGWDPRRRRDKACASAHKWLLVTCFGYLGYKNARFGRIEAHEAVTAYGREALLRAKEAAEELGFKVLHMYVDGLWVKHTANLGNTGLAQNRQQPPPHDQETAQVAYYQPLLEEIAKRTGLSIALEGIYRWVAFLPSRLDRRVPVANRYFGVFQDNSIKMRGIETRRRDTPLFVAESQLHILQRMAQAPDASSLEQCLPDIVAHLRRRLVELRSGGIPLQKLLVSQKLSKALADYRDPSPAARAAAQLAEVGKTVKQGQRVRFVYTLGKPGVHAWDLPTPPNPRAVDVRRYTTLLLRAASAVLLPLGVDEATLRASVLHRSGCRPIPAGNLPLWQKQPVSMDG